MNTVLPFSFQVHISLFAKGKVLNGEGSCSLKALVFHTGAHNPLWRKRSTALESTVIRLFSTLEAEMKLSVNVFQAMKSDLLTNLDCISFFPPFTMKPAVPVTVPASPLPPFLSCLQPNPAVLLQENFPRGWPAAGGNGGQDSKKRNEEHGNWEKGSSGLWSRRNVPAVL